MSDRIELRRSLNEVAFRQDGYFTAAQARSAGYTYQAQKYHVDRGNWMRIDRGLFRLSDWPSSAEDSFTRWFVWSEGRGVISHHSAAEVFGLGVLDPGQVHITMPPGFTTRNTLVRVHSHPLDEADIQQHNTFRVTSPTRTLLDLATTDVPLEQLVSVAADSLRAGTLRSSALRRRMDAFGARAALRLERTLNAVAVTPS